MPHSPSGHHHPLTPNSLRVQPWSRPPRLNRHGQPDGQNVGDVAIVAPVAAPPVARPERSAFLSHVLNSSEGEPTAQQRAVALPHDPSRSQFEPRPLSTHAARRQGNVNSGHEQSPTISQEHSNNQTLHPIQQQHSVDNLSSTNPPCPSTMPPNRRNKRRHTSSHIETPGPASKRVRRNIDSNSKIGTRGRQGSRQHDTDGSSSNAATAVPGEIEQIDLVDDDAPLREMWKKQPAEQAPTQEMSHKTTADDQQTFCSLTCVICLDTCTNLTATTCGHVFCYACLKRALDANRVRNGLGELKHSPCPVCRKNIYFNKPNDVIPLLLKIRPAAS